MHQALHSASPRPSQLAVADAPSTSRPRNLSKRARHGIMLLPGILRKSCLRGEHPTNPADLTARRCAEVARNKEVGCTIRPIARPEISRRSNFGTLLLCQSVVSLIPVAYAEWR